MEQFESLSTLAKIDYLLENGLCLDEFHILDRIYSLYALGTTYVRIIQEKGDIEITLQEGTQHIYPFIEQIDTQGMFADLFVDNKS